MRQLCKRYPVASPLPMIMLNEECIQNIDCYRIIEELVYKSGEYW